MIFTKGDRVWIEADSQRVAGVVAMASENGRSLMLEFEGMLFGFVNVLFVLQNEDGVFRDIILGDQVTITPI